MLIFKSLCLCLFLFQLAMADMYKFELILVEYSNWNQAIITTTTAKYAFYFIIRGQYSNDWCFGPHKPIIPLQTKQVVR